MADAIFDVLVSFFCPTSDAASTCNEFISNHSQVLPPIGPLFYFLLFPLVFTILFIYILSSSILSGGKLTKGMQLLIGISVFIFIIISGWYPIMLILSEVWFIMIILLFGAWYFVGKHKGGSGGGGGGGGGKMPSLGFGGAMDAVMEATVKKMDVQEKQIVYERFDTVISKLDTVAAGLTEGSADAWRSHSDALREASDMLEEFKNKRSVKYMGLTFAVDSGVKEKVKALQEAKKNLDKAVHNYRGRK